MMLRIYIKGSSNNLTAGFYRSAIDLSSQIKFSYPLDTTQRYVKLSPGAYNTNVKNDSIKVAKVHLPIIVAKTVKLREKVSGVPVCSPSFGI